MTAACAQRTPELDVDGPAAGTCAPPRGPSFARVPPAPAEFNPATDSHESRGLLESARYSPPRSSATATLIPSPDTFLAMDSLR